MVSASRLRPYFQANTVRVLTECPLKKILQKPDISGRLVNWANELGEFDIEYHSRMAIKGQALADFVVEFCNFLEEGMLPPDEAWVQYVDGSLLRKRSGVGVELTNPKGEVFESAIQLTFTTTNNEAKYEAIIAGMEIAWEMGTRSLEIRSDSQVITDHIRGEYEARGDKMKQYLAKVQHLKEIFEQTVITKILWEDNILVDALARLGSGIDKEIEASSQMVRDLTEPSITKKEVVVNIEEDPD